MSANVEATFARDSAARSHLAAAAARGHVDYILDMPAPHAYPEAHILARRASVAPHVPHTAGRRDTAALGAGAQGTLSVPNSIGATHDLSHGDEEAISKVSAELDLVEAQIAQLMLKRAA